MHDDVIGPFALKVGLARAVGAVSRRTGRGGGTTLPDGPPTTAARIGRPVEEPPPMSSMSVRSVPPTSSSTMPGRRRCPERPKSLVPRPSPRPANQAPPRWTIGGTAQSVSTLLMTVGLPNSP